ncbi:hypothetical protein [Sphingomonas folli]|uniref:hypothetical protein n=1 Tax=Sphingomonas folli TaxID=2862497 RepID=UPI00215655A4|nr:hypothetical protein [Sphingomonas folli]
MRSAMLCGAAALITTASALAEPISPKVGPLPSPAEAFPTEPGSDYYLADYDAYER